MICSDWIESIADCCDAPAETHEQAITAASEILYALSGRQFPGECTETVRPCSGGSVRPGFSWARWSYPWIPTKFGNTWLNIGPACGCHVSFRCGCNGIPEVNLGRSDVTNIDVVNIDGTVLDPSAYRLDDGQYLVRTDGGWWPCCQDMSKDIGETGTWYITLDYGSTIPEIGKIAAKKLACELAKACSDADCALPSRVTTLTRQGVSMTLIDPQDFLDQGRTGIIEVDYFLMAVNPNGLARRSKVYTL